MKDDIPSEAIRKISETSAFDKYPFSLLGKLKTTMQSPKHHPEGSVWNHMLMVLDEAAKRRQISRDPKVFMWAALLHDIGKPDTTRERHGKITAYEHDVVGTKLTRSFLSEFADDQQFIDQTAALVRYHMQVLYVVNGLSYQDINGMVRDTDVCEVALFGLCDRLGRGGADIEKEEKQIGIFLNLVEKELRNSMAKAGMRRPDPKAPHGTESNHKTHFKKNRTQPVPELQGKAKFTKEKAGSLTVDAPDEQT